MWDYYNDKMLRSFLIQYNFDFERAAKAMRLTLQVDSLTAAECRTRWHELHQKRKDCSAVSDSPMVSPLHEFMKKLPTTRKSKDFLKVTAEDRSDARTVDLTGSVVPVKCILTSHQRLRGRGSVFGGVPTRKGAAG